MAKAHKRSTKQLKWFAVKTLFRSAAVGRPTRMDNTYDPATTMVEERVVLFRAHGFDQAIRAAEREAVRYARDRHVNPFGQHVVTRYLGACDAYELFDAPNVGTEVFSTTEVLPKQVSDRVVINQRLGHRETSREFKRRRNILNREFAGDAQRGV